MKDQRIKHLFSSSILSGSCLRRNNGFKVVLLAVLFTFSSQSTFAQDNYKEPKFAFKGYLKNMSSFNYIGDSLWYENLTHNRLNFAYYPTDNLSVYVEIRNRIFAGDFVKNLPGNEALGIPGYGDIINNNNDFFTLSTNIIDNGSVIFNVAVDRAFVDWVKDDWEVKVGRQRINWGVNLAWNPNDWFNAYSFFDFDYEERPGSDAIRITKYTGVASSIEVAVKAAKDTDHFVAATMWKVNKGNYDIQFLGGLAQGDVSLGTGWAGNLGGASLKGELTYFIPAIDTEVNKDYTSLFLGAISLDYSFANSLYLNGSVMYNSNGDYDANLGASIIGQNVGSFTVRDLSPYPWSAFAQSTFQFSPLLFGGMAVMVYPGTNGLFLNPYITLSVVQNLDADLVGQLFYADNASGRYDAISKAAFVRLKWSF
ncbi:hypothetical protein MNBD_BACTEROID06-1490 [hydrothermal vent metagenome]|uniref:Uncharacterized protein n=1 Tax=hydrothermal vent metagenome TaxID=652676 RepID=A0A3B0V879_9ZZZZ